MAVLGHSKSPWVHLTDLEITSHTDAHKKKKCRHGQNKHRKTDGWRGGLFLLLEEEEKKKERVSDYLDDDSVI